MTPHAIRLPAFKPIPAAQRMDYCTASGAQELADRLKRIWELHGWRVETRVEALGTVECDTRGIVWCVRSDMRGAVPRRRA